MRVDFLARLTTSSAIGEVPGYSEALEGSVRVRILSSLFHDQPELPGVLLTEGGRVYSAVSRRYYLEMVGRYCGMDLYHGRPIRLMMERFEQLGGALAVESELSIREAVQRGLERSRELIYEPLIVRLKPTGTVGSAAFLVDFEDLLVADSRLSYLRNAQLGQILGSIGEGLMLVGEDRRIGTEYSRAIETMLGSRGIAGRTLPELLAERLDAERCRLAGEYLEILFRPSVIEGLVTKLNPLEKVELANPGERQRRVVAFRFSRSLEHGRVRHVLVRVEDVTRSEEQARELAAQRETTELRLGLAVVLAETEPDALGSFLPRLGQAAGTVRRLPELELAAQAAAHAAALRELHTLKGEAGLLGLQPFRAAIHGLEDLLGQGWNSVPGRSRLLSGIDQLELLAAETRSLLARFRRLGQVGTGKGRHLLGSLARFVDELAMELGKRARFVSKVDPDAIPAALEPLLQDVLVQLVRNSLTHGIESPSARIAAGKPLMGTLQLALRPHARLNLLELVFQDDGAGLDAEAIRARARARGLAVPADGSSGNLIFQPGISTARTASEHAGRGLGLDVVKSRVEALGGRIAVHSEPGRFCAFQILLPRAAEAAA